LNASPKTRALTNGLHKGRNKAATSSTTGGRKEEGGGKPRKRDYMGKVSKARGCSFVSVFDPRHPGDRFRGKFRGKREHPN